MDPRLSSLAAGAAIVLAACNSNKAPEPTPEPVATQTAAATKADKKNDEPSGGMSKGADEPPKVYPPGKPGDDPHNGKFTLAEATKDMKGSGPIVAKIDTSKGSLQCKLLDDKAPNTVANFIGLATGKRAWKDARSNTWVSRPAYDGTTFHRIIKGFMIQGGDQLGNGSGEPGYVIKDELWEGAKHDRAGLLCMANRGHDTNGAQFFVTDAAAAHLDNNYTIFGECAPVDIVHEIASVQLAGERPTSPVKITSVTISRDEKKK